MKNSLFFCALLLLGLASCQKEDLNTISTQTTGSASIAERDRIDGTATNPAINSEYWKFCGRVMIINRTTDQEGGRTLTLSDMTGSATWKFRGISGGLVPNNVRLAAKPYFAGYTMGASWQTVPAVDSGPSIYLIESVEAPGVAVMAKTDGTIVCNGQK